MEHRGDPGHEAQELAPGEVERPPGLAPSPADIPPGSPGSARAAGTSQPAVPAGSAGTAGRPGPAVTAGQPAAAVARPPTGDARVDEAVSRLADLAELPVAEHPAVFEYVHERLTEALGDLDVHDPAGPGGPGGTGGRGGGMPGPRAPGG
jgi:hypothetical protein